jgi:hypothetical protein
MLIDRKPHERLDTGQKDGPLLLSVLGVQREVALDRHSSPSAGVEARVVAHARGVSARRNVDPEAPAPTTPDPPGPIAPENSTKAYHGVGWIGVVRKVGCEWNRTAMR